MISGLDACTRGTLAASNKSERLPRSTKVGTVTPDVAGAVKAAKGGAVEFRVEKAGIIHAGVGKVSFPEDKILENIRAFTDAVTRAKPAGAKGTYVKRVAVSVGASLAVDEIIMELE